MIGAVLDLYAAALNTAPLVSSRLATDLRTDHLARMPAGATRVQLAYVYAGRAFLDSNRNEHGYVVTIKVHHKLGAAESERAWTEDGTAGLEAFMRALGSVAFWKVAGVKELDARAERPLQLDDPVRVGRVVSLEARAQIITTS